MAVGDGGAVGRVSELVLPAPIDLRPWQAPLVTDPAPRITAVVHRRAGKTTALTLRGLLKAATLPRTLPRVVHVLPLAVQWDRTGAWDQAKRMAAAMHGARPLEQKRRIEFPNGGVWQAGGFDNPDSWRGGYADEFIADEYDDAPVSLIPTVVEPMLADREGVLVRSGTPKGTGLLAKAFEEAGTTAGHSRYLLTYRDTGALSADAIARLRLEMSPEEFAQELECSFEAPNTGSYFGRDMATALAEGRITRVPWQPGVPVVTAWDLGRADSTVIWVAQRMTREARLLACLHGSGRLIDYYAAEVMRLGWPLAETWLPHDAAQERVTGDSAERQLRQLGMPGVRVLPPDPIEVGIAAARRLLPSCVFDAQRCAKGIDALRTYRRQWNVARQVFSDTPLHSWESDFADAFRYLALAFEAGAGRQAGPPRLEVVQTWTPYG